MPDYPKQTTDTSKSGDGHVKPQPNIQKGNAFIYEGGHHWEGDGDAGGDFKEKAKVGKKPNF